MQPLPTVQQILDLCGSATTTDATAKGDRLGWDRLADSKYATFRARLEKGIGPVGVVGGKWGPEKGGDTLTYWHAESGGHTCYYDFRGSKGVFRALSNALGPPIRTDGNDAVFTADWSTVQSEVSFTSEKDTALIMVVANFHP